MSKPAKFKIPYSLCDDTRMMGVMTVTRAKKGITKFVHEINDTVYTYTMNNGILTLDSIKTNVALTIINRRAGQKETAKMIALEAAYSLWRSAAGTVPRPKRKLSTLSEEQEDVSDVLPISETV